MAKPVNVSAIGQLLKLTDRRIQQLVKENVLPRPVKGLYEPVACIHAYIDYLRKKVAGAGEVSLTDERTRLTKCQADLAEMALAKARGQLIPAERARMAWGSVIQAVRQKLLSLPVRLAPRLASTRSIPIAKEILEESIREVLHECANPDLAHIGRMEFNPESVDLFPPASAAEGERVGGPEAETLPGIIGRTGELEDPESRISEGDDGCV